MPLELLFSMGGESVNTGTDKQFAWTKSELQRIRNTDTHATKDFKRAFALHKYFKTSEKKYLDEFRRHFGKEHTLTITFEKKNKKPLKKIYINLQAYYENKFRPFLAGKVSNPLTKKIPEGRYKITTYKNFLLFKLKQEEKAIYLKRNITMKMIL